MEAALMAALIVPLRMYADKSFDFRTIQMLQDYTETINSRH